MTKKKKSSRNAFISSVLMICLTFTMFAATTFAWFTESVESGRNTIIAGSMEMIVERYKGTGDIATASNWEEVTGETKIFPDNTMFEPGAVYVAYVRVKNAGDLAFDYKLSPKVFSETQGENQAGVAFSLSDYLYFGTAVTTAAYDSREAALAAIGTGTKMNAIPAATDAYLEAGQNSGIIAIVIYMPTTVGSEANPKPDHKPSITFGLNAIAKQRVKEYDNFGNDYDTYSNYPELAEAPVAATGATIVSAETVTVTVPAGSTNAEVGDTLTLKVDNKNDNTTDGVLSMDIKLVDQTGAAISNTTTPMTVTINVGTGKVINGVKHNGTPVTGYTYDENTGILTFTTTSFSPFSIDYVEGKGVATVAELKAALADSTIDTIVLTDDIALNEILFLERSVTFKGQGYELSSTSNRVVRIKTGNLNIKFYDTKIVSKCTATSDVRGISFDSLSAGTSLLLDNCTVSASFYAINATPNADNLRIDVVNGTVAAGWAAFNLYSNNSVINVTGSTLRGLNDKGEGSWNNFNTITFDGNSLSSAANVGNYASDNTMNITNSTVYASSESGNTQWWVGLQYGALRNTINVDAASRIIDDDNNDLSELFHVGYYCNYNNGEWTYYENGSNKVIIAGVEQDYYKHQVGTVETPGGPTDNDDF